MDLNELFENVKGFDWDGANEDKNWDKHKVRNRETEEIFFNKPLIVNFDKQHSKKEIRFQVLGRTNENRELFVVFTVRDNKIRVISARDMSKKERRVYEKEKTKANSGV